MLVEMNVRMGAVIPAAADIMSRDPAPVLAVMAGHPDPVITFMPVTATVIIRPVANVD